MNTIPTFTGPSKSTVVYGIVLAILAVLGICAAFYGTYMCGYTNGTADTDRRMKQEAIDAGVAEYGPNPKATKFQWKPKQ